MMHQCVCILLIQLKLLYNPNLDHQTSADSVTYSIIITKKNGVEAGAQAAER